MIGFIRMRREREQPTTQREIYRRNRERLCLTLRDERLWPWSFVWNYQSSCDCAMGLAAEIGLLQQSDELKSENMARVLGMSEDHAADVFVHFDGDPTPKNVARAIMHVPYTAD